MLADSGSKSASGVTIEAIHFGEVEDTDAFAARLGISRRQLSCMKAQPQARASDVAWMLLHRAGERVGRLGMFPGCLRIAGRDHRMFWGASWEVDRSKVGGAGGLLMLMAMREVDILSHFGMSNAAREVIRSAGFEGFTIRRRSFVLQSAPFFHRKLRIEGLARFLAQPTDAALALLRKARTISSGGATRTFSLQAIPRFDDTVDEIERSQTHLCRFVRGHQELNWVIEHPWIVPESRYQYCPFYLRQPRSDEVVGYALMRLRDVELPGRSHGRPMRLASLLRWAVRPDVRGATKALLDHFLTAAIDAGADTADIGSSNPAFDRIARSTGGIRRGPLELAISLSGNAASELRAHGGTVKSIEVQLGDGETVFC